MKASAVHHPYSASLKDQALAFCAVIAIVLLWPDMAFAQTAGDIICRVAKAVNGNSSANHLANLFNGVAYCCGAYFVGNGLYKFKEYSDSPGRPPLHQPIARCIGGVCLLALPNMIGWLFTTLAFTSGGGGISVANCAPGAVVINALDPSVWFSNFVKNIKDPLTSLTSIVSYTIGVFLIIRGFIKLSKYGTDPRAYSLTSILASLMIGSVVFSLGSASTFMLQTVFGVAGITDSATANVTGWKMVTAFGGNTAQFVTVLTSGIMFFQVMGGIAFLRGWLILKNAAEGSGQATMAQGLTHIIGGIMAMNMFYVLKAFDTTLGTQLL